MGYYNYLCELLRPLRVYRLDEGAPWPQRQMSRAWCA